MKWRAAVDRAVAHLGLTHGQYSLLASLRAITRAGSSPTQRQLADHTALDPIHVSKLAKALEAQGLIHRSPDPSDARAVRLSLTRSGITTIDAAIGVVRALMDELTNPLGGRDGTRTRRLMKDIEALLAVPSPTVEGDGHQ